jgi:hypothetical protein
MTSVDDAYVNDGEASGKNSEGSNAKLQILALRSVINNYLPNIRRNTRTKFSFI